MILEETSFEEILPFWQLLWPGRKSPIEPASSMLYLGGYDVSIKTRYQPRFFAVKLYRETDDGWITYPVGVNSGHQTSETHYRSRGIWVDPSLKLRGMGRMLIDAVEKAARQAGCSTLWSIPRQSAMPFYKRCGFMPTSYYFKDDMEFGPNCYAMKALDETKQSDNETTSRGDGHVPAPGQVHDGQGQ
jgi:GNAT superfamily N-acetyltransferase